MIYVSQISKMFNLEGNTLIIKHPHKSEYLRVQRYHSSSSLYSKPGIEYVCVWRANAYETSINST